MKPGERQPRLRLHPGPHQHRHAQLTRPSGRRSQKRRLANPCLATNNEGTAALVDPVDQGRKPQKLDLPTKEPPWTIESLTTHLRSIRRHVANLPFSPLWLESFLTNTRERDK